MSPAAYRKSIVKILEYLMPDTAWRTTDAEVSAVLSLVTSAKKDAAAAQKELSAKIAEGFKRGYTGAEIAQAIRDSGRRTPRSSP